MNNVAQ